MRTVGIVLLCLVGAAYLPTLQHHQGNPVIILPHNPTPPVIVPVRPILPAPRRPQPSPCPGPNCPLRSLLEAVVVGGPRYEGVEVMVDLPVTERIHNIGSHRDGAGMCVDSSIEMMFRWCGVDTFRGFRDWAADKPGGGYPGSVSSQIPEFATSHHVPVPSWFQYEGDDPSLLLAALRTGRPVAVTYSGSDSVRYQGPIAHMVLLVHFDGERVGILDNNFIGEEELLWMPTTDFLSRWRGSGQGWAVFCTSPPPPPPPR